MSQAVAAYANVPAPVTLAEWDREWSMRDDIGELVEGVPTFVSPSERRPNIRAAMRLATLIATACEGDVEGLPGIEVALNEGPTPTIRRPDLVVAPLDLSDARYRLAPGDVLLVVEVLSASTADVDTGDKLSEYAEAGIGAYLIVDVRGEEPQLTLHTKPRGQRYTVTRSGDAVVLTIGERMIPIQGKALTGRLSQRPIAGRGT